MTWEFKAGDAEATPCWRSLMYVPAHIDKFIDSAPRRGADAIILDLEDAVPTDQKKAARERIPATVERVARGGADVLVRINRPLSMAVRDIEAAVGPRVRALSLPKVESAAHLQLLDELVSEVEGSRGLPLGTTGFIVLIESARGLASMGEIATASPRLMAMTIGGEDLSLDLGMESNDETLFLPKQQLIQACAIAKIMPLGTIGSIANLDNDGFYLELAKKSRRFGFVGSSCIHPRQVALLNQAFTPTTEELAHAERVVKAAEEAEREGRGAVALDGKMIDIPVVGRARRLLAHQARINARADRLRNALD